MQYRFSDYPLVIEPTEEVLEIVGGTTDDNPKRTHLHRISTQVAILGLPGPTSGLVHFFGLSTDLSTVPFVLGYTSGGRLSRIFQRQGNEWDVIDIPLEALGEAVIRPSVRFAFKTERARFAFLHYLGRVIAGDVVNPALAVVLDQLDGSPQQIDVWKNTK